MEQFDAIDRSQEAFVVQPDSYISVPQQQRWDSVEYGPGVLHSRSGDAGRLVNSKRIYIYGGIACAFIVFIALTSSSASSNKPNGNGMNNNKNPMVFHGRHPPAGEYHDSSTIYIREDISGLSTSYTQDTELTTIIESIKVVKDLSDNRKQWDVTTTRLITDTEMLGQSSKCDTDDRSHGDPVACAALFASADTKMSFVIDADGTVVSETDTDPHGHISKHSRSSGGSANMVETVDNTLKYLPEHQVAVGEDWDAQIELSSVGSYSGRTTFIGYKNCGNAECAVLESSGNLYMDVKEMAKRFAAMAIDESMMSIIDGTMSQTIHWDDEYGYFPLVETYLNFTIKFDVPMQKAAFIPVKEKITAKSQLVQR